MFFCLLYSLHHVPLMQPSSIMHLCSCALPPCSHWNFPHDNNNHNNSNSNNHTSLLCIVYMYRFCASCACNIRNASTCTLHTKFLRNLSALSDHHHDSSASLVIFHHASNITGCSAEISQRLWQLKLIVFSVKVKLTFSVSVTGLNAHPTVNCLHENLHPS
jgi:hypothetical protein